MAFCYGLTDGRAGGEILDFPVRLFHRGPEEGPGSDKERGTMWTKGVDTPRLRIYTLRPAWPEANPEDAAPNITARCSLLRFPGTARRERESGTRQHIPLCDGERIPVPLPNAHRSLFRRQCRSQTPALCAASLRLFQGTCQRVPPTNHSTGRDV